MRGKHPDTEKEHPPAAKEHQPAAGSATSPASSSPRRFARRIDCTGSPETEERPGASRGQRARSRAGSHAEPTELPSP